MKTRLFLLLFLLVAYTLPAQKVKDADVPQPVKEKFASLYPSVKSVHWGKEGANYEAEFDQDKKEMSVVIDPNGNVVETEVDIAISDLPQSAKDYVTKNLPGKKIKEASKITAADGTITYEAEVSGTDYIFDANGNFLKTEKD